MYAKWNNRLGCAGKLLKLPVSDNRKYKPNKPENNPSLHHSCEVFAKAIDFLDHSNIHMFRIPSNFCPYATHPQYPDLHFDVQFHQSKEQLMIVREKLHQSNIRVSFHPTQFILLSSPNDALTETSIKDLMWQSTLLDFWERPLDEFVFLHGGGVYGDRLKTSERLIKNIQSLPNNVKQRFALENDEYSWSVKQLLPVCLETNTPLIFDVHHHRLNPDGWSIEEALTEVKKTWNNNLQPKVHLSSSKQPVGSVAKRRAHADYIDIEDALLLFDACDNTDFFPWVMLEAKAKEQAVFRLRKQLLSL